MQQREKNKLKVAWRCLLGFWLLPAVALAVLTVQTQVVSGRIVAAHANNAVQLDNGSVYRPSRKGLKVDLRPGENVTLRYYKGQTGELVFFEYKPGVDSLAPLPPAPEPARRPGF